jgi:two-component system cell cycle sensor histidine kinase/response regulator CckA
MRMSILETLGAAELLEVLEAIESTVPVGLGFVDRDLRVVWINAALAAVAGVPAEQQVGRTVAELVPVLWAELEPLYRRVLETGESMVGRELVGPSPTAAGEQRCWLTSFHAVRIDGRVVGIGVVAFDITDRKRTEQELLSSRDYADRLIQTSNALVLVLDLDANIVTFNRAAEEITGYAREEVLGRNWDVLLPRDRYPEPWAELARLSEGGLPEHFENPILTKSGAERIILWQNSELRDSTGGLAGTVSFGIDVTETVSSKKQSELLEGRLRQAEKMEAIGQLAGGIAHDFNNLLVAIRGYTELALGRVARGEDGAEAELEGVLASADRAAGLTKQLLALGRRQVLNPEVIDLNVVVDELCALLQRVIGANVEVVASTADSPVLVRADRGLLEQVITNLAVNGRDAMPDGGRLTIRVATGGADGEAGRDFALLAVTDEGSGIDPATAAQIFEPYFTTKGDDGTGLGLATVHGIVAQSGGHIALDTELGRGSTFTVHLPLSAEERAPRPMPPTAATRDGTESILLVDDDPAVRSIVARFLKAHGYEVIEAADGEEAILLFENRECPIDLVVTDVMMSGLNGRQTAARIREIAPAVKVLYMSGYSEDVTIRNGTPDSATGFIQKPFAADDLADRVRELLDTTYAD